MDSNAIPQQDISKDNSSKEKTMNSLHSQDITIKGLILWFIPILGPLLYMTDADKVVKFHAKQSLFYQLFSGSLSIIFAIFSFMSCLNFFIWLAYIIVAIFMIMKLQNKEEYKLPIIGDMVK